MTWLYCCLASALLWLTVLLLPWRPWSTRESLDADLECDDAGLGDVTALVPARNEAAVLGTTLRALAAQGEGLKIVVIDDQSRDDTRRVALESAAGDVTVLTGAPLPRGWTGKLWALEQGRPQADRPLMLLVDADIALAPGTVAALRRKMNASGARLISLMAAPPLSGFWERLLLPAYIYFFKLLYPFRLANSRSARVAAAAGGCILLETRVLEEIGGFAALRGELIDDCALARRVKHAGHRTWIGLTHSARMQRRQRLADIWNMVARTAFTQLRYSVLWLGLCTALLVLAFAVPLMALVLAPAAVKGIAAAAGAAMAACYLPTLRYYGLSRWWAAALPFTGTLYLAMTWTSALRCWRGRRSQWKDRVYPRLPERPARE
jgi:hopene-associated glycosyltransferase HpnB